MDQTDRWARMRRGGVAGLLLATLGSWATDGWGSEPPAAEPGSSPGRTGAQIAQAQPPPGYGYPAQAPPPAGYGYPPPASYPPPQPARRAPVVVYDWDPDIPPPRGYELDWDATMGLVGGGIGLLAAGWTISLLVAAVATSVEENEEEEAGDTGEVDDISAADWSPLYIPVAGPFVAIGTLKASGSGVGLLVADGIIQSAGVLGIVLGVAAPDYKLVRMGRQASIELSPAVGTGYNGLNLTGSF